MSNKCTPHPSKKTKSTLNVSFSRKDKDIPDGIYNLNLVDSESETVVNLQHKTTKRQWECVIDDNSLEKYGPKNVKIPRTTLAPAINKSLLDFARDSKGSQTLRFETQDGMLKLIFRPDFGHGLAPVYSFPAKSVKIAKIDILAAQIQDLQNEVEDLRAITAKLRQDLQAKKTFWL